MKNIYKKIDQKLSGREAFEHLLSYSGNRSKFITFLNPFSYKVFLDRANLIDEFDVFFADGALLVKLHNFFNKNKIDRLSFDFSSIANDVFRHCEKNHLSVSFVGAKEKELEVALHNIKEIYPTLDIVYSRNGYFKKNDDYRDCFEYMKSIKVDLLIVGMGSPYQEEFSLKLKREDVGIPLVFTCGGFLTQSSIKPDYYYPVVKMLGLRWLQRAIMHKHVRERLLTDYPKFIVSYIYNHISN